MESRAANDAEPPKCLGGCGHTLTSPQSLARRYGPCCWRKLHGHTARRPRTTSPAAKPGPGQPELPYDDQLTLWTSP